MKKFSLILAGLLLVLAGIVIGFMLFLSAYRGRHVVLDGPSMEPTIHAGQAVTITKYDNAQQVNRGDIVEYHSSNDLVKKYSKSGKHIHRVVALPGERITVSDGKVLVYNAEHPEGFNPDSYLNAAVITSGAVDTTVPAGTFFVMGDNRPNALDSRAIGPIPYPDIIGKISQ